MHTQTMEPKKRMTGKVPQTEKEPSKPAAEAAPKLYITDERMLLLIERLKQEGVIKYTQQFCDAVGLEKQNIRNIKTNHQSFTVDHIRAACQVYSINANWIFGFVDTPFRAHLVKKIKDENKEP